MALFLVEFVQKSGGDGAVVVRADNKRETRKLVRLAEEETGSIKGPLDVQTITKEDFDEMLEADSTEASSIVPNVWFLDQ